MTTPAPANLDRRARAIVVALALVALALAADLWVKAAAWNHFVAASVRNDAGRVLLVRTDAPDVTVIPHGLELTAVANQGAAMGMGQGRQTLFLIVSGVATLALVGFFAHSLHRPIGGPARRGLYRTVLALLLAGVLGNFYDRLTYAYVRDMLHMLPRVRWPGWVPFAGDTPVFPWVFNLADVYLCAGVGAILLLGLFPPPEPAAPQEAGTPQEAGA